MYDIDESCNFVSLFHKASAEICLWHYPASHPLREGVPRDLRFPTGIAVVKQRTIGRASVEQGDAWEKRFGESVDEVMTALRKRR